MLVSPNQRVAQTRGFSLLELMVGIVVGMVALLVIYRTVNIWDTSSRTTTAGGDAQVAGTIGMFSIERDIKLAGMGFGEAASAVMGCQVVGEDAKGNALNFPMFPVQIASSPGLPDTIDVLAGNSSFFVGEAQFQGTPSPTTIKMGSKMRNGFRNGDVAIMAGNDTGGAGTAKCQLIQITDNALLDGLSVAHAAGSYTPDPIYAGIYAGASATANAQFNGVPPDGAPPASAPVFTSGTIYNLGPQPTLTHWEINNQTLQRTDLLQNSAATQVANGVIDMHAEYGLDTTGTSTVSEWTISRPSDWKQVIAIRIALLVRSAQFERPASPGVYVTASTPMWGPASSRMEFTMSNVAASNPDASDWRNYRYRVYEKIIPLRNIIWGQ